VDYVRARVEDFNNRNVFQAPREADEKEAGKR
jgi:hypothetical protein